MKNTWIKFNLTKIVATFLMMAFAVPMFAYVEGNDVQYIGGTIGTVAPGTVGKLDTVNEKELRFVAGTAGISIPYAKIDSYQYTEEVAHHLGALPTIAIVMIKYRQRRHYFRISYRDENDKPQSVVLEVSKEMPKAVSAVLESRVPKACNGSRSGSCNRGQTRVEETKSEVTKSEVAKTEVAAK
jgi:hypothetical protein